MQPGCILAVFSVALHTEPPHFWNRRLRPFASQLWYARFLSFGFFWIKIFRKCHQAFPSHPYKPGLIHVFLWAHDQYVDEVDASSRQIVRKDVTFDDAISPVNLTSCVESE